MRLRELWKAYPPKLSRNFGVPGTALSRARSHEALNSGRGAWAALPARVGPALLAGRATGAARLPRVFRKLLEDLPDSLLPYLFRVPGAPAVTGENDGPDPDRDENVRESLRHEGPQQH